MVYQRRRTGFRGRRRTVLSRLSRPKKGTAVQALAKQVATIKKSMKKDTETFNYMSDGQINVSGNFSTVSLCDFGNWTRIFGVAPDDENCNTIIWKSMGLDCYLTHQSTNDEEENVTYTVFLVSPKDEAGGTCYNPATGNLSLTAGAHYAYRDGIVTLNKKLFTIHKVKRFTLGNFGQNLNIAAGQKQYGNDMRWYWKLSLGRKIYAPTGNWRTLNGPTDTGKSLFMLVFNNNSGLDLEYPQLRYNGTHTIQTP